MTILSILQSDRHLRGHIIFQKRPALSYKSRNPDSLARFIHSTADDGECTRCKEEFTSAIEQSICALRIRIDPDIFGYSIRVLVNPERSENENQSKGRQLNCLQASVFFEEKKREREFTDRKIEM